MGRFDERDIERWVREGIVSAAQRDAILRDLARHPSGEGLTITTLLYYGGGLLVLLAYSIFLGVQWEELAAGARVAIAGASLVFFAVVSQALLRDERFRLPGELLQVATVAVVPLFVFALLDATGAWPEAPGYHPRPIGDALSRQYQIDLTWARMGLGGATLAAAALGFRLSRSPFVLIAALASFVSLVLDVTLQWRPTAPYYEWGAGQALAVASIGAATLAAAVRLRGRTERDYTIWLYLAGIAGLAFGLGIKVIFAETLEPGWGALWMATALIVLALSLPLQERLFAAVGLAGIFVYLARLVFDVFETANAALVLVVLGVLVLGAGVAYQRYSERLFGPAKDVAT